MGRIVTKAEAQILWPPDVKSQLAGKDPDAAKDWRQKEKGAAENKMVRQHHLLISRRQWRTEEPGVLKSMRSQRVGHHLAAEWAQHPSGGKETFGKAGEVKGRLLIYTLLNLKKLLSHMTRSLNPKKASVTWSLKCGKIFCDKIF